MQFPNINPEIINLYGPIGVRWYSLAYIIGFLFAAFFIKKNFKKLPSADTESFINYNIVGMILFARLAYVIFYDPFYYLSRPFDALKVWEGGLSFHGGLLGVILATILFIRRYNNKLKKEYSTKDSPEFKAKKLYFFELMDIGSVCAPLALAIGRFANFINSELYGRYTASSIGVVFPTDPLQIPRHPVQLYECAFEGVFLFCFMMFLYKKTFIGKNRGYSSFVFILCYSIGRFFLEFFKDADSGTGFFLTYFTMGHILCLLTIAISLVFLKISFNKKQKRFNFDL